MCTSWDVHKTIQNRGAFNRHAVIRTDRELSGELYSVTFDKSRAIAKESCFPLDGEGDMNDHSKQKSINSRRSFIAGFGGVVAAAAALTRTTFSRSLKRESQLVPASPSTPRYTEHHISRDGVSLHVEDHGSGKPVVLLHGWPDSSRLWRNQIPFLVAIASALSHRTNVASGAPIARKEWPHIPCRTRSPIWSAFSTR